MCYTVKIDLTREQLENRFGARFREPHRYRPGAKVNAFSLPALPVICNDDPREIRLFTWGLIPYWVKNAEDATSIRTKTFNAKAETLAEKPSFRAAFSRRRCLVLTNGFYEWQAVEKRKIPYFISLKKTEAFALAGLYENWTHPATGEILSSFTVVTTRANALMEEIHNVKKRMPVILEPGREDQWLNLLADPVAEGILEPYPDAGMVAQPL